MEMLSSYFLGALGTGWMFWHDTVGYVLVLSAFVPHASVRVLNVILGAGIGNALSQIVQYNQ